jgi:hypothetical protein
MVQVPPSYEAIEAFLGIQGVKLLEGDVWGHRKDLDEYFTIDDAIKYIAATKMTV